MPSSVVGFRAGVALGGGEGAGTMALGVLISNRTCYRGRGQVIEVVVAGCLGDDMCIVRERLWLCYVCCIFFEDDVHCVLPVVLQRGGYAWH